jgi:hypothetical protein
VPYVCRGQYGDLRLPETTETVVVVLITQRSRVQVPPPLPTKARGPFSNREGAFCVWFAREMLARSHCSTPWTYA